MTVCGPAEQQAQDAFAHPESIIARSLPLLDANRKPT
jgi:hypothetical protein